MLPSCEVTYPQLRRSWQGDFLMANVVCQHKSTTCYSVSHRLALRSGCQSMATGCPRWHKGTTFRWHGQMIGTEMPMESRVSENYKIWISDLLKYWISDLLNGCDVCWITDYLNIWNSESLIFRIYVFMNYWNSVILSLWIAEFRFIWIDKNMSFWLYKTLKLIISEYAMFWLYDFLLCCNSDFQTIWVSASREKNIWRLMAAERWRYGWPHFRQALRWAEKVAGALAISGKMTNFEEKKCWNYADIRTILSADLCHHERHRSSYQACCKARYAAFGGVRSHYKTAGRPKEFRKGIDAWRRFCVPGFASVSGVWL